MPDTCQQHTGIVEKLEGLVRQIDHLSDTTGKTNEWLQKIVSEALARWSPGAVKAFIALSAVTGALVGVVITLLLHHKGG